MTKSIKLNDVLTPQNSKVAGISINRHGDIVKVRVRLVQQAQPNVPAFNSGLSLNPILIEAR